LTSHTFNTHKHTHTHTDALVAPNNGQDAVHLNPIPGFGATDKYVENIENYGGYTIFTEAIQTPVEPFEMPCFDPTDTGGASVPCTNNNAEAIRLVSNGNSASESSSHTTQWGMTTLRMKLMLTFTSGDGCRTNCPLVFKNNRTGEIVQGILGVLHFAWVGEWFYFFIDTDITSISEINNKLVISGDEILIQRAELSYLRDEDNVGVSFVYGVDLERSTLQARPSRLRIGSTSATRDYTVYTINRLLDINPGYTYIDRQYVVSGRFVDLNNVSRMLSDQSEQRMIQGEAYNLETNLTVFHEGHGLFAVCRPNETNAKVLCSGTTTPRSGSKPLFYITCGSNITMTYLGHDPYGLSVVQAGRRRPWMCYSNSGDLIGTRPSWHLIGYFPDDSCANITGRGAVYNDSVCDECVGSSSCMTTERMLTTTTTTTTDFPLTTDTGLTTEENVAVTTEQMMSTTTVSSMVTTTTTTTSTTTDSPLTTPGDSVTTQETSSSTSTDSSSSTTTQSNDVEESSGNSNDIATIGMYMGVGLGATVLMCFSYLLFCGTKRQIKKVSLWETHNPESNNNTGAPYEL
jgi:hypothetical protein